MNAVVIGFDVKSFSSVMDNREKKEIRQYLFNLITTAPCYQINNLVEDKVLNPSLMLRHLIRLRYLLLCKSCLKGMGTKPMLFLLKILFFFVERQ